ncbi:NAD(P)/FAD-dependent oxidoreductase [Sphingobacterium sp. SRCM116780]|uniref:NAD(P)/FAD-dependent oxidoreductase n=1 Tax=Sphingobacterium sp. SRCM116780 TaxID=2907623 RepID=UPI001F2D1673|nr:NAD(P)/FAD-dependent oxidoreductase [Sphingobacterium sp. SRCM116780]UIR54865.1 NAD(P)/FAD-dependent oxidoreductase [Sphingobacterium sp. SRCM116780]
MRKAKIYDAIVIGGSYAGLSAAMTLGRSLRNVLIIDSGMPCNWQTPHSHNFLTQDGKTPFEIATLAKQQVAQYKTVEFCDDFVIVGEIVQESFALQTKAGANFTAKKLIFATGIRDIMPDIKGFSACWGISVIHCPYCHGYEFRHQKTGLIANGDRAMHLASLVHNLTDSLCILTTGKADFQEEQFLKLKKNGIEVITTKIAEIVHEAGHVQEVIFEDGARQNFDAVYAVIPFVQHSDIPAALGCELTEQGHIKVDGFQKTTIPGIYACGDSVIMMRSVASAVSSGNLTGAMVNMELTKERF